MINNAHKPQPDEKYEILEISRKSQNSTIKIVAVQLQSIIALVKVSCVTPLPQKRN